MDRAVQDERGEQSRAGVVDVDRARRLADAGAARAHAARAQRPGRTTGSIDGGVGMRRSISLATWLCMGLALAACGKSEQAKAPEAAPPEPTATAEPAPAPTADAAAIDAALANTDRFA